MHNYMEATARSGLINDAKILCTPNICVGVFKADMLLTNE